MSVDKTTPEIPNDKDAEKSALGCLILEPKKCVPVTIRILEVKDFYYERHQKIYQAIVDLFLNMSDINYVSVSNALEYEEISVYLTELANEVISTESLKSYVDIIKSKSRLREIIKISYNAIECCKRKEDSKDIANVLIKESMKLVQNQEEKPILYSELLSKTVEYEDTKKGSQYHTGYRDLDMQFDGFSDGEYILLAARPSMGKTALAFNLAINIAKKIPVGFISLEMGSISLGKRALKQFEGLDPQLRSGFDELPLYFQTSSGKELVKVQSRAYQLYHEFGCRMIFIDYLQLIRGNARDGRNQELTGISGAIKDLAQELNIPVCALSQLSREVDKRQDPTPMLSDLRESGALEQDADAVMFLYRPGHYDDTIDVGISRIIIAKQRNGATHFKKPVELYFEESITYFRDKRIDDEDYYWQDNAF